MYRKKLLTLILHAIAKMEGLDDVAEKEFPEDTEFLKNNDFYDRTNYSELLLLLVWIKKWRSIIDILLNLKNYKKIKCYLKSNSDICPSQLYEGKNELTKNPDDRIEFKQIDKWLSKYFHKNYREKFHKFNIMMQNMEATVIAVRRCMLVKEQNRILLKAAPLHKRKIRNYKKKICRFDNFGRQYSSFSRGSGFVTHQNSVITAGHLFYENHESIPASEMVFISGFNENSKERRYCDKNGNRAYGIEIPKENIFKPLKDGHVIAYNGQDIDWAIIRIEPNEFTGKYPKSVHGLSTETNPNLIKEQRRGLGVYGCGYGIGLPNKFYFDGEITNDSYPNHFRCCLDFFGGNSGSPVFDASTHKVLGILVRGEGDFSERGIFLYPRIYKCEKGNGEQCQRLDAIIDILN